MKTLFTIAILITTTSHSLAQGYVAFNNGFDTRFSTNRMFHDAPGTGFLPASVLGSYYFELFAAPSTQNTISTLNDPTLNGWTAVALGTNLTASGSAGRLQGNNVDNGTGVMIPGFAAGSVADFAVAGWSADVGNTWAQAQYWWDNGNRHSGSSVGFFGINPSIANDVLLNNAGGPYDQVIATFPGRMPGWGLSAYYLPEPNSFALAGLGATMGLLFRRRKV